MKFRRYRGKRLSEVPKIYDDGSKMTYCIDIDIQLSYWRLTMLIGASSPGG